MEEFLEKLNEGVFLKYQGILSRPVGSYLVLVEFGQGQGSWWSVDKQGSFWGQVRSCGPGQSVLLPLAEGRGVVHPHIEIRPIDAYIDKENV